ncbi:MULTISPECIES: AlpA family phage regulatory protein [unclassified Bradyrhizobium]|uniref:helix-turn-helix transcriptional regulator n=1 Tax=unclassified Bradyrhizobium TaxID=2631580 RepID=UPI001FF94885|nr:MULTISPECIES: AlpA family phage regulatory protein [unclassified Bradyrhizobium]MCK1498915.1 AlpA family phage regulatory protein [Bradyrhizobium sp. 188]MCK1565174.1 AlpA family phage regulatory protein [Bradyrhizobium sp. 173]MCK1575846.1 AlpA family phage regulatory protein [Bradyrhizobium sp. 174]UPJ83548.1 AlpA family phage regulatory protein [Bradyrhizobium sp. 184]UPJ91340.1 AlpA family phage regulatory protein [Bradyrhizobium sp. 183]
MSARKLLLFPELSDHGVPFGRRYIDRLEAEGKFPRRVPIGAKRVGWVATEIEGWVSAAIARRSRNVATQVAVDSVA